MRIHVRRSVYIGAKQTDRPETQFRSVTIAKIRLTVGYQIIYTTFYDEANNSLIIIISPISPYCTQSHEFPIVTNVNNRKSTKAFDL